MYIHILRDLSLSLNLYIYIYLAMCQERPSNRFDRTVHGYRMDLHIYIYMPIYVPAEVSADLSADTSAYICMYVYIYIYEPCSRRPHLVSSPAPLVVGGAGGRAVRRVDGMQAG